MSSISCIYDNSIIGNGFVFYKKDGYRGVDKLIKFCTNSFSRDLEYVIVAKDNDFDIEEGTIKNVELVISQDSDVYLPLLNLYSKLPGDSNKILYSSPYSEESIELNIIEESILIKATRVVNNPIYLGNDRFSITLRNTPYLPYLKEFYNELNELNLESEYFFPKMRVKTNY